MPAPECALCHHGPHGALGPMLGPVSGSYVHRQCAIWSPEVFQTEDNTLSRVMAAIRRGRQIRCGHCGLRGATLGCRLPSCQFSFHLPCAKDAKCSLDSTAYLLACPEHAHLFRAEVSAAWQLAAGMTPPDQQARPAERRRAGQKRSHLSFDLEAASAHYQAAHQALAAVRQRWQQHEASAAPCGAGGGVLGGALKDEDEVEFAAKEARRLAKDVARLQPIILKGRGTGGAAPGAGQTAGPSWGPESQGFERVGGLREAVRSLKEMVVLPLLYPDLLARIGTSAPGGILLHGPPGTGKTLLARAVAEECARVSPCPVTLFARKGADCLGKYAGDAERTLRLIFEEARRRAPSIVFLDELDALVPSRSVRGGTSDQIYASIVSTLLSLMDGLVTRGQVVVIGATNRADSIDAALRRPGRFDREMLVGLPGPQDRAAILQVHTRHWPHPPRPALLRRIADATTGYAGADLAALASSAVLCCLRRQQPSALKDLDSAWDKTNAGTSPGLGLGLGFGLGPGPGPGNAQGGDSPPVAEAVAVPVGAQGAGTGVLREVSGPGVDGGSGAGEEDQGVPPSRGVLSPGLVLTGSQESAGALAGAGLQEAGSGTNRRDSAPELYSVGSTAGPTLQGQASWPRAHGSFSAALSGFAASLAREGSLERAHMSRGEALAHAGPTGPSLTPPSLTSADLDAARRAPAAVGGQCHVSEGRMSRDANVGQLLGESEQQHEGHRVASPAPETQGDGLGLPTWRKRRRTARVRAIFAGGQGPSYGPGSRGVGGAADEAGTGPSGAAADAGCAAAISPAQMVEAMVPEAAVMLVPEGEGFGTARPGAAATAPEGLHLSGSLRVRACDWRQALASAPPPASQREPLAVLAGGQGAAGCVQGPGGTPAHTAALVLPALLQVLARIQAAAFPDSLLPSRIQCAFKALAAAPMHSSHTSPPHSRPRSMTPPSASFNLRRASSGSAHLLGSPASPNTPGAAGVLLLQALGSGPGSCGSLMPVVEALDTLLMDQGLVQRPHPSAATRHQPAGVLAGQGSGLTPMPSGAPGPMGLLGSDRGLDAGPSSDSEGEGGLLASACKDGGRGLLVPCRLLLVDDEGGDAADTSAALLLGLVEGAVVYRLSLPVLVLEGAGDPVEGCLQLVSAACRACSKQSPRRLLVLHLPQLEAWTTDAQVVQQVSEPGTPSPASPITTQPAPELALDTTLDAADSSPSRARVLALRLAEHRSASHLWIAFRQALEQVPPDQPLLVIATSRCSPDNVAPEVLAYFTPHMGMHVNATSPGAAATSPSAPTPPASSRHHPIMPTCSAGGASALICCRPASTPGIMAPGRLRSTTETAPYAAEISSAGVPFLRCVPPGALMSLAAKRGASWVMHNVEGVCVQALEQALSSKQGLTGAVTAPCTRARTQPSAAPSTPKHHQSADGGSSAGLIEGAGVAKPPPHAPPSAANLQPPAIQSPGPLSAVPVPRLSADPSSALRFEQLNVSQRAQALRLHQQVRAVIRSIAQLLLASPYCKIAWAPRLVPSNPAPEGRQISEPLVQQPASGLGEGLQGGAALRGEAAGDVQEQASGGHGTVSMSTVCEAALQGLTHDFDNFLAQLRSVVAEIWAAATATAAEHGPETGAQAAGVPSEAWAAMKGAATPYGPQKPVETAPVAAHQSLPMLPRDVLPAARAAAAAAAMLLDIAEERCCAAATALGLPGPGRAKGASGPSASLANVALLQAAVQRRRELAAAPECSPAQCLRPAAGPPASGEQLLAVSEHGHHPSDAEVPLQPVPAAPGGQALGSLDARALADDSLAVAATRSWRTLTLVLEPALEQLLLAKLGLGEGSRACPADNAPHGQGERDLSTLVQLVTTMLTRWALTCSSQEAVSDLASLLAKHLVAFPARPPPANARGGVALKQPPPASLDVPGASASILAHINHEL